MYFSIIGVLFSFPVEAEEEHSQNKEVHDDQEQEENAKFKDKTQEEKEALNKEQAVKVDPLGVLNNCGMFGFNKNLISLR